MHCCLPNLCRMLLASLACPCAFLIHKIWQSVLCKSHSPQMCTGGTLLTFFFFSPLYSPRIKPPGQLHSLYAFTVVTAPLFQPFRDANHLIVTVGRSSAGANAIPFCSDKFSILKRPGLYARHCVILPECLYARLSYFLKYKQCFYPRCVDSDLKGTTPP